MRATIATEPGSSDRRPNEDWATATPDMIVVLDGATARTETGCTHGIAWYANKLGASIVAEAADHEVSLRAALGTAIADVADMHPQCDLVHPGTPSAAVGILRLRADVVDLLVLADVSIVVREITGTLSLLTDDRVKAAARKETDAALSIPLGDPGREDALVAMKRAQMSARNRQSGFYVAAADPIVAEESMTATFPAGKVSEAALLTDGAARATNTFGLYSWEQTLDLLGAHGPQALLRSVRAAEMSDPSLVQWPRTKLSDDATVVYALLAGA